MGVLRIIITKVSAALFFWQLVGTVLPLLILEVLVAQTMQVYFPIRRLHKHFQIQIPSPSLRGHTALPNVCGGDDIFPLKLWLIKPYPGRNIAEPKRIYNQELVVLLKTYLEFLQQNDKFIEGILGPM